MSTDDPLPFISQSSVHFQLEINESKSDWDPNWTIQREISINLDKTLNSSSNFCSIKIQILFGIGLLFLFILSVIIPLMILLIDPRWPPTRLIPHSTSSILTTQIKSNGSSRILDLYSCENLLYIGLIDLIGFDLLSNDSMSWSSCCQWCRQILSCRGFTFNPSLSICYLKRRINNNGILNPMYRSAKYP